MSSVVANPLYAMADDGQNLYLDVLSRDRSGILGKITLAAVHDAPPAGGLALGSNGYVLVTNTASLVGSAVVVQSSTVACRVSAGSCSQLLKPGGSDTVDRVGTMFAVPLYEGAGNAPGRLGLIVDGSPPRVEHTVPLPSGWFPGPIALASDGKSIYWITAEPPLDPNAWPAYKLLHFDLAAKQIVGQIDFGIRFPGALTVDSNGDVYVAITYASQGTKNPPTQPTAATTVEVFKSDLSHLETIEVASEPFQLSLGGRDGTTLAVAYQDKSVGRIDLVSTRTRAVLSSVPLPAGHFTKTFLSSLSNGDFAIALGLASQQFRLDLIPASGGSAAWRTYSGDLLSGIAG
jgi:hypothetical protein